MAATSSAFCPVCQQQRPVTRATSNNLFHLIMTLLTGELHRQLAP